MPDWKPNTGPDDDMSTTGQIGTRRSPSVPPTVPSIEDDHETDALPTMVRAPSDADGEDYNDFTAPPTVPRQAPLSVGRPSTTPATPRIARPSRPQPTGPHIPPAPSSQVPGLPPGVLASPMHGVPLPSPMHGVPLPPPSGHAMPPGQLVGSGSTSVPHLAGPPSGPMMPTIREPSQSQLGMPGTGAPPVPGAVPPGVVPPALLEEQPQNGLWVTNFHFRRSRTYSFVVDASGRPIEIGSGRYARVFLGQERWIESLTDLQRLVVIKMLHKNISPDDAKRFRMEKEILERVQGHPAIVEVLASGTCTDPRLPPAINALSEGEFVILEKLDMNLEERLKGSRNVGAKEDLLGFDMHDRLLRVLEYMLPIASAVEYAHLVRNVSHRDINPANILLRLPDPALAGSTLQVRLADFGVAKAEDLPNGVTRFSYGVPGAMYFQSPEQELNVLELLVSVQEGSAEVDYFEDFYVNVGKNDTFAIFNRRAQYQVLYVDRARRKIVLTQPWREQSESNIRAHVQKSVGRPADIYSLGALFYYLISGATANPKTLYDTFHKFIEYERPDESNTIDAYLRHEYQVIDTLRSAKADHRAAVPLDDRFFGYTHYLDGNGELIHFAVMLIIARAMMRNKPDAYCQAHDLETRGISLFVRDLTGLYSLYGLGGTVPPQVPIGPSGPGSKARFGTRTGGVFRQIYDDFVSAFAGRKKK